MNFTIIVEIRKGDTSSILIWIRYFNFFCYIIELAIAIIFPQKIWTPLVVTKNVTVIWHNWSNCYTSTSWIKYTKNNFISFNRISFNEFPISTNYQNQSQHQQSISTVTINLNNSCLHFKSGSTDLKNNSKIAKFADK